MDGTNRVRIPRVVALLEAREPPSRVASVPQRRDKSPTPELETATCEIAQFMIVYGQDSESV